MVRPTDRRGPVEVRALRGLTVDDLAARRHELAEVCFVDTVVVERRPGRLDTVEVIRVHRTLGART